MTDSKTKIQRTKRAIIYESIGLARLSLCYTAQGNAEKAITTALESLCAANSGGDPNVVAMSQFFVGRALLLHGHRAEAIEHFNAHEKLTPAIVVCKEPSEDYRQYLRELIEAGADMDLVDEHGYSALDYAVFSGDRAAEEIVIEGLRQNLNGDVEHNIRQRQKMAEIRKNYRELFQAKLRLVLINRGHIKNAFQELRLVYFEALAADEEKRSIFYQFKYVPYPKFRRFGKLPCSSDGLTQTYAPESSRETAQGHHALFVIFFSYRWINKATGAMSPDDINNTQYQRMVRAVEEFLRLNPTIREEDLGIWIVSPKALHHVAPAAQNLTANLAQRTTPASTSKTLCQASSPYP